MTDSASNPGVLGAKPAAAKRGVALAKPSKPDSMARKNRWKRRGASKLTKRLLAGGGVLAVCALVILVFQSGSSRAVVGPDGPFGAALAEAFPEADQRRVETRFDADGTLPIGATLHLPAYLIEPGQGIGDPFISLSVEFGGAERTLSGVEMGARLERISASVLPDDLLRCHTYKIGQISSPPDAPARTRALHIHLNPNCN